ncbi:hypothetical protein PVAP13_2KG221524 [Panicum virgatum]|uniref:Uncharacterized protein n=1 Tax=Panicum virgatum TaxID=38727 RepID=A0A8T0W3I8_PANVG|nr:hypothetical protein PVAP13_2KG221524 [Panicum virgatum]
MSGGHARGHAVAKLYFNYDYCGVALSDGAFTCDKMVSTDERCQWLFCHCQSCARINENSFNHDIFRAQNLDYIISTASANIQLMVNLVAAQTQQDSGSYTDPPLPRCTDVFRLFSFRHLTAENNFKISILID